MITSIFSYFIFLLFPLFSYFMYLVYNKATFEKEKLLFFDLALISSYYLCIKYNTFNYYAIFFVEIPLFIALYKKRLIPSLLFIISIMFLLHTNYHLNIYLLVFIYTLLFIFSYVKKTNLNNLYTILKILFFIITCTFFSNKIVNFSNFYKLILYLLLSYLSLNLTAHLCKRIEKVIKLYSSFKDISKEKKLYESLFKITHEIKNPLAVCKGYLDMFDVKNEKKINRYIGIITQEIDRTLLLLKDFSNASKLNVEKSLMDINLLIDDILDEVKLICKNSIKFNYELYNNEVYIIGDYNRLKQVLINIIKNSKEALENTKNKKIFLETKKTKDKFIIIIKDNGEGMDKEIKKKIGTAFYTTKKNGTGLGVCFSKEIIEKHKGEIHYFSKQGKGTTVKIILPIEKNTN